MTPKLPLPPNLGRLPKLHVYIDETGDRGFSDKSRAQSPFFAMTALIVPGEDEWTIKATAGGLRALIHDRQPQTQLKPLHWVEHFRPKRADRRDQAAHLMASMPTAQLIHVVTHKNSVNQDAGMRSDKTVFYNYTARLLMERVAHSAKRWPGGARLAIVRFGAVKHLDHTASEQYLHLVRHLPTSHPAPWTHIKWPPTWEGTQRDGIQLADIHAGFLNCALSGDPNDNECAKYLLACRHQLRRSPSGAILNWGIKVIGDSGFLRDRAWWPDLKTP
ncbi:DUF3800 domain-containing protein [Streptomyces phytohabitans]|uniref:DUF3800 domain-containing protein n=1 Tax=Streptomyces phytohabitans TaxID=1150371 RepID=UPI00345BEB08